ncbi:hypothetical protein J6590_101971 [Homalodisca vitripennis]|nr:hypothetical protein J6590_101971 [Homalodisca vitripennis]
MGNLNRVLGMQKRAIRVIAGLSPRQSCRDVFKNLNILTEICEGDVCAAESGPAAAESADRSRANHCHALHQQSVSTPHSQVIGYNMNATY